MVQEHLARWWESSTTLDLEGGRWRWWSWCNDTYQLVGRRWISCMGKVQNWNRFIVLVQRLYFRPNPYLLCDHHHHSEGSSRQVIPRRSRHIPGSWLNVNPFYSLIIIILLAAYPAGQVFDTLNRLTNKLIPQSAPRSPNYRVFLLPISWTTPPPRLRLSGIPIWKCFLLGCIRPQQQRVNVLLLLFPILLRLLLLNV